MSDTDPTIDGRPSPAVAAAGVTTQANAAPASMSAPTSAPTPANANKRKRLLSLIALVVVLAGIGYGVWYFAVGAHYESTDDAYVAGNVVQVTPQVAGTVIAINADDTDIVRQGQDLVVLDPSDARVALDQAEAQLAQTVREVRTVYANNGTLTANIATRQADTIRARSALVRAQDDYQRRAALVAGGAVSKEELQHVQSELDVARSTLAAADAGVQAAREQLASNQVSTDGTSVAQHPNVLRAAARVREAYLAVERATLPAPVSGQVAKRGVQLGQRVAPGTPLMAIVPLNQLWVDANFKEVQLRKMRIGQPVTLEADLYGGKVEYKGRIVGLSAGTGSAFSLLPAQNATGNWIKVVQRVPVRIEFDPKELAEHPLRIGLSVLATIDTSNQDGQQLAAARGARNAGDQPGSSSAYQTKAFAPDTHAADAIIDRIVAANLGRPAGKPAEGADKVSSNARGCGADAGRQRALTVATMRSIAIDRPAGAPPSPAPAPAAGYPPLTGSAKIIGTISLALATFMNVLDTSIANVSLSSIGGDLGVSSSQATWVITSFAVANAIALPLTGWLTQRFGAVKLFTASVLLFVVSSWLCGLATSLPMLILFRVLQGFVAGPMIPLSQALLLSSYPKAQAGMALAVWSITTLVAPVMGPVLGGWITDNISWPWIFYINIPVGIAAAWVTWTIFRHRETPIRKLPIDGVGLGLLVLWVGSLQIVLDKGKELDWFSSGFIVALTSVAAVAFACFLVWELVDNDHPVVDLRLFRRRNFWTGSLTLALGYGVFFGNVVLLPLWLQQYMGYTATDAGMLTAPVGLFAILLSPVVGKYIGKVDPRKFATTAFLVFAASLYWRTTYNTQANFTYLVRPIILQGAAMAFFFIPLVTLTLSGLPPDRIAAASGLSNFLRITAGAFGTSIATTMWEDRAILHHARLAEAINSGSPSATQYVQNLQGSGLSADQTMLAINRTIDVQAYMLGVNDIFYASALLFVMLIGVVWIARPVKAGGGAAEAAAGAH